MRGDVRVGDRRHLIFYTDTQLQLMAQADRWYMDGTFKIIRQPFMQLFSVHAFIKQDGQSKMIPLVFIMMSCRRTKDYKAVSTCNIIN